MGLDSWIERYVRANALNYERGSFDLLGLDGLVMPVRTWVSIFERFHEIEGFDAVEVMFDVGKEHGKLGIDEVGRSNDMSRQEFVEKVMDTANVMGMGLVEVEVFDSRSEKIRVTIEGSPLNKQFKNSETLSNIERPIHGFWRGVFHTVSGEIFGSEMTSEEVKCEFQGAEKCVIVCKAKN